MQYFHLEQPADELILCDQPKCDTIADYLEIKDNGAEHHLCAFHTRSQIHACSLPARSPDHFAGGLPRPDSNAHRRNVAQRHVAS
jgi:hypothetical protein